VVAMTRDEMLRRTKQYALRIIKLVSSLPAKPDAKVIAYQLLRCGTSVGANYRSACRARSSADFLSKVGVVEEETDESLYWQELLVESGLIKEPLLVPLMREGDELLSIIVATRKTVRVKSPVVKSKIENRKSKI
jgi:four helix bundle protein